MMRKKLRIALIAVMAMLMVLTVFAGCNGNSGSSSGYKLSQTSASLEIGRTLQLTISPEPANVTWSSSDEDVATVSDGLVTAVEKGTATITAQVAKTQDSAAATLTCEITVNSVSVLPESISITNEDTTPAPGFFEITAQVMPEGADQRFTASLVGEHTLVQIVDNEVAIDAEIEDGYTFTVSVASVADPQITATKEFVVDNRPEDGLHITTPQRVVDAQVNDGKLQLKYTMVPEAEVTFSLETEVDGVSITSGGEISVDKYANNGIAFTVVAEATVEEEEFRTTVDMTVLNEIEREISTEEELRAIWTGDNAESRARMQNHYILTDNIVLTSDWTSIANDGTEGGTGAQFNGNFNGNGYTISNFNMNAGWNNGFFYSIGEEGVVENLVLESGNGVNDGIHGMFCGPFAGYCFGTIQNSMANVRVTSDTNSAGAHISVGSFVGTIGATGLVINCVSIGQTVINRNPTGENSDYTTGFAASMPGTLGQCLRSSYALEGTIENIVGHRSGIDTAAEGELDVIRTEEEMKTAASYPEYDAETEEGFDREIWRIVDGSFPSLYNDKFVEPAMIEVKVNGEEIIDGKFTVGHGDYEFTAEVTDADGSAVNVPQSFSIISFATGTGVADGAFTYDGVTVSVNGSLAKDGDTVTIVLASDLNTNIQTTVTFTFEGALAVVVDEIPDLEYTADGANTFDVSDLVTVLSGSGSETVTYEITQGTAGVTINEETGVLTITAASNNTAVFKVQVTVTDGSETAKSAEISVNVVNTVPKEISTAEEFLAIWPIGRWDAPDDTVKPLMHNNYILTDNIDLGSSAKVIGFGWSEDDPGYGLFGTFDGNGYTISWSNNLAVSWNCGLFAKVEATGVIKNLKMQTYGDGAIHGLVAGPIGFVYGTVENCFFDVKVTTEKQSTGAVQPIGTAVAAVCGGGKLINVISIGQAMLEIDGTPIVSGVYGKTHDTDSANAVVTDSYALSGTVTKTEIDTVADKITAENTKIVLTDTEMRTASNFADWDTEIWYIADGAYPTLKNDKLVIPTGIEITNSETTVGVGATEITADVTPSGDWFISSFTTTDETNITYEGRTVTVKPQAVTGATFTVTVAAALAPSVTDQMTFTVSNEGISVSFADDAPETMDFETSATLALADYVEVSQDSGYTLSYALKEAVTGVSVDAETGVVTLTEEVNNTAVFTVVATVTPDAGGDPSSAELTITVTNHVFKEINGIEDLQAIWTGNNAVSCQNLTNNYILMTDIDLSGVTFGTIGIADTDGIGLSGTFDGNGHKISGVKMDVSWNGGFFARIESTGVVKNLHLESGTGADDGVQTIFGGALVGFLYGKVENCFVNVRVYTNDATRPIGTLAGTIKEGGLIVNSIAIGQAVFTGDRSEAEHGSGFISSGSASQITSSFVLDTTVDGSIGYNKVADENIVKTETELKTAATFEGWDSSIWTISEGSYPALIPNCTSGQADA